MKKILLLFLTITLIIFSGCDIQTGLTNKSSEQIVFLPDSHTKETVNGYKDTSVVTSISDNLTENNKPVGKPIVSEKSYIGNTSSKKFHLPSCTYANNMKSENKKVFNSREEPINSGYKPCKKCNP